MIKDIETPLCDICAQPLDTVHYAIAEEDGIVRTPLVKSFHCPRCKGNFFNPTLHEQTK